MKNSNRRSRRHRNTQQQENNKQPFFPAKTDAVQSKEEGAFFQTKLNIGKKGDKYEQEADKVADAVVHQNTAGDTPVQQKAAADIQKISLATPMEDEKLGTAEQRMERDKYIQEKHEEEEPIQKVEEEEESIQKVEEEESPLQMQQEEEQAPVQMKEQEEETVQTKKDQQTTDPHAQMAAQLKNRAGKGKQMAKDIRIEMEATFGCDFGNVNIHTDEAAIEMTKILGAQAFTHGHDVYFNVGKYRPDTRAGKKLLAHELTHVVQQKK